MKDSAIIKRLEAFYNRVQGGCKELHEAYTDDIEFGLVGNQWDKTAVSERGQAKRLTLTVNRLRQFIYQVVNDYKQSEMTSKVMPHDTSEKDKVLAEVRRGMMRSIERKKGGLSSYNAAAKTLVCAGLGGWRINTRYVDPKAFDQEPYFIPIEDMTTVFWDFSDCREPDYSDMRDCVIQEKYGKDRFKSELRKDPEQFIGEGSCGVWGSKDGPTVSEYWFKEEIADTLTMGIDGKPHYLSELTKDAEAAGLDVEDLKARDEAGELVAERPTTRCKVWCAKVAAKQVIEKTEFPIELIPVVIVTGRKTVSKGKTLIEGLIRPAKDSQRSYNYLKSAKTERFSLSPKAPFMVPEDGIPDLQKGKWNTMNTANHPYLVYSVYDKKNRPIPPPHRTDPVQADQGLIEEERASIDEIEASLGMYSASIGKQGNETSGKAINARAREADTGNYDFTESMVIGIKYSTKILNKLIPKVYDTARQVSMVGEDDKEKVVMINQPTQGEDGEAYEYNVTEGDYDIDYEAGPSSATKTEQVREDALGLVTSLPQAGLVIGPTFIRNSAMRNADETADAFERFANTQIPGLFPEKAQGKAKIPPEVQQKMQQMEMAMQQMQERLQQAQQAVQENQSLKLENQSVKADKQIDGAKLQLDAEKLRIEKFRADTERMKVQNEAGIKQGQMLLAADNQQHKQTIESAQVVQAAHADKQDRQHNAESFAHQREQDGKKNEIAAKVADSKVSQQGKRPTGANPGKQPSSPGVKP